MFLKLLPVILVLMTVSINAQMPQIEPGVSHEVAVWRAAHYSDVRYRLNLTLEKMSPVLKGTIEIRVKVSEPPASAGGFLPIILDWRKIRGSESLSTISNVSVNGVDIKNPPADAGGSDSEHLIFRDGVRGGENVIKLDFTSPILTSGSAITRYIDKEDGSEYIYSLFVPSDASTAFPVFDQPDLKARFQLTVIHPSDWAVISNSIAGSGFGSGRTAVRLFSETKPISTYVFAFAAGPWQEFGARTLLSASTRSVEKDSQSQATVEDRSVLAPNIYVRKSQAAKFQPHAAEVFRLIREGVKYLEEYFDYKFPFPKYDIVLIPEFPFGGMEHAGATFLRESAVIFPSEPTANDYISRANLIFHETAHQWFGDTVTMRWFDDLWLKEGFAEFMAYKTLERVMPQYNAWKAFYERNKPAAYFTDSTRGTTPIYQEIANLSAAKSAYGNIVYRKAPSFLRQAEFYLGPDKFQTAVRAFLKKHEYSNATWQDLVSEFEAASGQDLKEFAHGWVEAKGGPIVRARIQHVMPQDYNEIRFEQYSGSYTGWKFKSQALWRSNNGESQIVPIEYEKAGMSYLKLPENTKISFVFPNYGDYGYGIFLLDPSSRDYVLKNIQNEKDDFLRSMMWGALWDSVREAELDPREYVELAIKNLPTEKDEMITSSVLGRVSTAMTYYIASDVERVSSPRVSKGAADQTAPSLAVGLQTQTGDLQSRLEAMLIDRMRTAPTLGQRLTYYRAFLNIVSTENGRNILKQMLRGGLPPATSGSSPTLNGAESGSSPTLNGSKFDIPLKTKDRFDIVTRLAILKDPDAAKLLADLEKTEVSDDAKRYAYAAHAAFPTKENREKFWNDFVNNKDISESWIEAAIVPFNSPRHSDLSLPYLQRALTELPNLKRTRKIFFINGWLGAFIGGQKSQEALDIVNKFLADNPNLDRDLRLKILENMDVIERSVKIRNKYSKV